MKNETVTLDRELVEKIPEYMLRGVKGAEDVIEALRAALAEPVPPAGGDVKALVKVSFEKPVVLTQVGHLAAGMELVDRAHVTRLQAEVEQLKGLAKAYIVSDGDRSLREHALRQDNERLQSELTSANADKEAYAQNAIDLRKRVDALQAELNKAREYIQSLRGVAHTKGGITLDASIDAFLAHRSAPAAKD